jgi:superfamily I DNA/RNA helicase
MKVVAGPGTGKSYSLKKKVMRLIEEGSDPEKILAVTFTNVAADALKKDLHKDLKEEGFESASKIKACTLHSLCFSILIKEKVLKITGRYPRPLMEFEREMLVEDLSISFGGKKKVKEMIAAYEAFFAREQSDDVGKITNPIDLKFKKALLHWLQAHKAMLIGEVISETIKYLRISPNALEKTEFEHILVDEYQDLNKAEQLLIHLLSECAEVVIIGDEDQSIYSFKHAHPEGILEYGEDLDNIVSATLNECRRCPKSIVKVANEFMEYEMSEGKTHKILKPFKESIDGMVYGLNWDSEADEANIISKFIKEVLDNDKEISLNDILVLSPRRHITSKLQQALAQKDIVSKSFFSEDALSSEDAKKSFTLLAQLAYPDDEVSLRTWLGLESPLSKTYLKILEKCNELSKNPSEIIQMIKNGEVSITRTNKIIERFDALLEKLDSIKQLDISELVKTLFDGEDEELTLLHSIIQSLNLSKIESVTSLYNEIQARILFPQLMDIEEDGEYIKIMSLHKSKGLSAKLVIILGCIEGLIPSIKNEKKLRDMGKLADIERLTKEQERLFFVAMTRSRKYLFFSSVNKIEMQYALRMGIDISKLKNIRVQGRVKICSTLPSQFLSKIQNSMEIVKGVDFFRKLNKS